MTTQHVSRLLAAVTAMVLATSTASAALITIPNWNFETNAATRSGQTNSVPPNWTKTGATFGTMKPSTLSYYNQDNPNFLANNHGELVAFAQGGATLSQTLSDTYVADTIYNLKVLVGDSYEGVGGTYEIQLLAGSTVYATSGSNPFPLTAYTSVIAEATFATGSSGGAIGQPITINIIAATGATKTFDNVTLEAISVVPEPATLALQGAGGLCLAMLAYRRRRRQA
jgi:hypothetical protein